MTAHVERIEVCCPSCYRTAQPVLLSRVHPLGWVLFVLLGVFPLGLLGLLLRQRWRICRCCRSALR